MSLVLCRAHVTSIETFCDGVMLLWRSFAMRLWQQRRIISPLGER